MQNANHITELEKEPLFIDLRGDHSLLLIAQRYIKTNSRMQFMFRSGYKYPKILEEHYTDTAGYKDQNSD